MNRSDPSRNNDGRASDSSRDGLDVRDELPAEFPILEEELLWLTDVFAQLLSPTTQENAEYD